MSTAARSIPVGVVVERRKAISQWAETLWRPVAVLVGSPDVAAWTVLAQDGHRVAYYAGSSEIALYGSEVENYRRNLSSETPAVWVVMHATAGEPPYVIGGVSVDPAEGERWSETGTAIVEAVAMPAAVRDEIAAFVAQFPAQPNFVKRQRDRADPEVLARQAPRSRRLDGRR
jgi:hypothetical protein